MNITVLGAGAWGTALAVQRRGAPRRRALWARDAGAGARRCASTRRNERYLPERRAAAGAADRRRLRRRAGACADGAGRRRHADGRARARCCAALPRDAATPPCSGCARASRTGSGALGHEIARAVPPGGAGRRAVGAELRARGRARPADRAGRGEQRRGAARRRASPRFHGASLRIYTSDDPVGVEVGGAVKNVLAIATGIADGMAASASTRAPR